MDKYIVSVYTASGLERIMSGAKDQDEAAKIAENLKAGGYTDIVIRKAEDKLTPDRNLRGTQDGENDKA